MNDVSDSDRIAGEEGTREATCLANWPECYSGGYDPRCCRFPKSCSVVTTSEGGAE